MGIHEQIPKYPPGSVVAGLFAVWAIYLASLAIYRLYFSPLARFPGPRLAAVTVLPKLWHMARGEMVDWMASLHHEHGPIVRVGPSELGFVNAQAWQDIYGFQPPGRAANRKDPKFYDFASMENMRHMINANDQDHSRMRHAFSHAFSNKALKEQEPLLVKYVDLMGQVLQEKVDQGKADADLDVKVDMVQMLNFTAFDMMGDLTFGEPLYMLQNSEYIPWVKTIFDSVVGVTMLQVMSSLPVVSSLVNLLLGPFIIRARQAHFKYSTDRVDRRLALRTARPDIWTQVLRQEGERALSLDEMHTNADMFMIAGTETTATLTSGLIYYLLMNLDKMRTLQKEIRGAFKAREDITMGRLAQLKYLNACIEEGLRMYPPVPIGLPRLTPPGGTAICGEWIPADTSVYVTAFAAFRSPANFRAPDEFIPERWISSEYDSDNKSALQPFSIGPRNCLGKNLAYHEMRLIMATVLHRFDMSICAESRAWNDQKVYGLWKKPPLMVKLAVPDGQRM